ncbi:hypothetical protein BH11MYX4_BH11MYX4_23940 [soil metagenome]
MNRPLSSVAKDEDGAIIVTGLFACAFLIGALWYLLGIGDAILFKERMQDGADAVAFAPSVIHARGMNLIALLNITMAAILAVFVGVKITQALLLAATVIACLNPYNPDCYYLASQHKPYKQFVDKVEKKVDRINKSLADTGNTVAKEMPSLAARRAAEVSRAYAPMVEGGFSASISQVPGDSESSFCGSLADGGGGGGGGKRLGLPVEDDDYENLCNHSGTMIDIVFVPTIAHYSDGQEMVTTSMKYAAAALPGFLKSNQWCGSGSNKPKSKRVYKPARHGNDYFATWGFTTSSFIEKEDRGGKGLAVATWQRRTEGSEISQAELDRSLRMVQVAKSEFYYDPRSGGPRDWDGIKEEALWNLRWRARLRRVSQPNDTLARFFSGPGLGPIVQEGSGSEVGATVRNVLAASPEQLAGWTDKNVGPASATRRTGGIVH